MRGCQQRVERRARSARPGGALHYWGRDCSTWELAQCLPNRRSITRMRMNAAGRRSRSQNGRRSAHNHDPTRLRLPSRDTGSPTRSATAAAPRYGCPLATRAHRRVPRRRLLRGTAALSRHGLTCVGRGEVTDGERQPSRAPPQPRAACHCPTGVMRQLSQTSRTQRRSRMRH